MRRILAHLILALGIALLASCNEHEWWGYDRSVTDAPADAPAYSLSVSSDGTYALSAHGDRKIVLWDITAHKHRVLSDNGNLFSAYFVKGSHNFIWQDLEGVVHVQNVNGKELSTFRVPPVYGHVLSSDLRAYVFSGIGWGLYLQRPGGSVEQLKSPWGKAYLGFGKLLNIQLSNDDKSILQSGYGYEFDPGLTKEEYQAKEWRELVTVAIWNLGNGKPKEILPGNIAKTYATFSPDGKYVVSGDEGGRVIVWDTNKKKELLHLGSLFHGVISNPNEYWENWIYDKTGLIPYPNDYSGQAVLSLKFIDTDNHYLRITANQHYAILYAIDNPLPLKYLDLGRKPYPATRDYSRNTAIDSAPEAGILVTGQAYGPGINVYKYDKKTQTLRRIWVAK